MIIILRKGVILRTTAYVMAFSILLLTANALLPGWAVRSIATLANLNRLVPVYCVESTDKVVALSFDAAWGADFTDDILETLAKFDIPATFFLVGFWVEKHPDVAKMISDAGHEIGNHSSTHPHMPALNVEQIRFELSHTHDLIKEATGQSPRLFRPPFGEYSNRVIETLESMDYLTIQWSVDSLDWRENMTRDDIINRVTSRAHPGAIVLFHNNATHTPAALEPIILALKEEGYAFKTIGDLLLKDNWYIDKSNGMQRHKRP
jgi:polysaccharide deacetylase family sporulation protein PdaB